MKLGMEELVVSSYTVMYMVELQDDKWSLQVWMYVVSIHGIDVYRRQLAEKNVTVYTFLLVV